MITPGPSPPHAALRRSVTGPQVFALSFGTIIGVGWVVYLGYWLAPAGPLGAVTGFAAGTLLMLAVGLCYGEMAALFPVSGGEVAYSYETYGPEVAFLTGWMLAIVYTAVTSWEAISLALLVETLLPAIAGPVLYVVAGEPVHVGTLAIGLGGMSLFTVLLYRGIHAAARLQYGFTLVFFLLCLAFITAGIGWGDVAHLAPAFQRNAGGSVWPGILAAFMTAPFFLAGFDTVPQVMEERAPETSVRVAVGAMVLSIAAAGAFYCLVILAASMAVPWRELEALQPLPAVRAVQSAFGSPALVSAVLGAALLGLLTTWNAVCVAASRVVFALGRARMIPESFGAVHPIHGSPTQAVIFVGLMGSLGVFLGRGGIGPIVNMAVIVFALVYLLVCLGVVLLRFRRPGARRPFTVPLPVAGVAVMGALFVLALAVRDPYARGGGVPLEWVLLLAWLTVGGVFWLLARRVGTVVSEANRRALILGGRANGREGDR